MNMLQKAFIKADFYSYLLDKYKDIILRVPSMEDFFYCYKKVFNEIFTIEDFKNAYLFTQIEGVIITNPIVIITNEEYEMFNHFEHPVFINGIDDSLFIADAIDWSNNNTINIQEEKNIFYKQEEQRLYKDISDSIKEVLLTIK